jgi:hypothetical protein
MEPKAPVDPTDMKVTTQYFRKEVRICELACASGVLEIHISQPASADWVVEVHRSRDVGAVVITGSGTTSAAALTAAATEWAVQAPHLGLGVLNWKSVTDALHAVQAIK